MTPIHPTDQPYSFKAPSADEMASFDRATIESGITGIELMEQAGSAMFELIRERYLERPEAIDQIVVLCGPGNNGGDGLVVARQLLEYGRKPAVVVPHAERHSEENLIQAAKFIDAGGSLLALGGPGGYGDLRNVAQISESELARLLHECVLLIDAVFGTGQARAPRGTSAALLNSVHEHAHGCIRVALDLPSGMNTSTGELYMPHFEAHVTVTVELPKRGMLQYPARAACGEIFAVEAGIDCSGSCEFSIFEEIRHRYLMSRPEDAHKGDFGKVLVVGGSEQYPGAPVLSAHAALRCGAGLVTLTDMPSGRGGVSLPPELIHLPLGDAVHFGKQHIEPIEAVLDGFDALVIGPGLGQERGTASFFAGLLEIVIEKRMKAVLDADGLNHLSCLKERFDGALEHCVLTPHPGELSRLLPLTTSEIQRDRFSAVKELAARYNCCALLKGAGTLTYCKGRGVINLSGNPYMASGGSGDVLSGVIAALLAKGAAPLEAASLGAFLHGLAADLIVHRREAAVIATDIIQELPFAIEAVYGE
ncbi:MAG: NAD(P)H-hydrate dehydratase [Deltaproteobacteria bacterium]|nr:NAD(P)H-hydrate dehydratase [Deltaproteobacteria bacterium]